MDELTLYIRFYASNNVQVRVNKFDSSTEKLVFEVESLVIDTLK